MARDIIPQRTSLVAQTADVLRELIRSGEWDTHLPTESQLQERMQVGRNTVRSALAVIEKEGWVSEGRPGLRREILRRSAAKAPRHRTGVVALLAPDVLERSRAQVILTVGGLRDHLAELGFRLEIHTSKAFRLEHPERTIEALVKKSPADVWILHLATREIQNWFARHGIPCLIYGSTHEGIHLPCVDVDYAATVRHAVGRLLGKGHTRMALMLPHERLFGNLQGESAYLEALHLDQHPERQGSIIRVASDDPETVCKELKRIAARPDGPTAMLLWRVRYAMTVFSSAGQLGIRIPEDLSVICIDDSSAVEWLVPALSRYKVHQSVIISKLFRRIHEIVTSGVVSDARVMILPDWVSGGSIAPPKPS